MTDKGTTGITNLYLYLKFLNDTDDEAIGDIGNIESIRYAIDQTNSLISEKCGRAFGSTTYKEWVPTKGSDYIVVNNYPITKIKLVAPNSVYLMNVEATGFPIATVSSNNSSIMLNSIDTEGVEVESVFSYATYANVSSVVTAIDAVTGWDASVESSYSDSLTQLIKPIDSEWAVNEKAYFSGPYLGTSASVEYDTDAVVKLGTNYFGDSIGSCYGEVFIWYTAGYTLPVCDEVGANLTTVGNVPEGLTGLANQIISEILAMKDEDGNMKSEGIGDYNYSRQDVVSAIDRHWKDLSSYARKVV